MGQFSYRAATADGQVVEGVIDADGKAAVVARLRGQGYIPLEIDVARAGGAGKRAPRSWALPSLSFGWRRRVKPRDLMHFTRELATLLRAGLPLDRCLQSLATLTENDELKGIVRKILDDVKEGSSLSEALESHHGVFPPLYVNMVKAGEAGGVVESILERLADYLENSEKTRDEIRSAMTYPIILSVVGGISIIILLTYVLPKFTVLFADLGAALPTSTRIVMTVSDAIQNYWWLMAGLLAVAALGMQRYTSTPAGRVAYHRWQLSLPLFGTLITKIQVSRFARTLGTMLKSGVPLIQSLDIVRAIVSNSVIRQALESVQRDVSEGKGLAGPLELTGVFPSLALQMVAVGEDTGRLDDMLLVVSEHYERDVTNSVSRLMTLVEPALLLLMGLVAGFIVISMMSAIFSVNQLIE